MTPTRHPELRVVSVATESENSRVTLRIDAEQPVPAPLGADETRTQKLSAVERELDRLHQAVTAEQMALGQHMNWLIGSQAVFIHAFLMVFVVGSLGVIATNHWLLGGLALLGIVCALALHGQLDHAARTLAMLVVKRRAAEMEFAELSGRAPSLPKEASKISRWAGPLFVVVWFALLACGAAIGA